MLVEPVEEAPLQRRCRERAEPGALGCSVAAACAAGATVAPRQASAAGRGPAWRSMQLRGRAGCRRTAGSRSRPRSQRSSAPSALAEVLAGVRVEVADLQRLARRPGPARRARLTRRRSTPAPPSAASVSSIRPRSSASGSSSLASSESSSWNSASMPRSSAYAQRDRDRLGVDRLGQAEDEDVAAVLDVRDDPLLGAGRPSASSSSSVVDGRVRGLPVADSQRPSSGVEPEAAGRRVLAAAAADVGDAGSWRRRRSCSSQRSAVAVGDASASSAAGAVAVVGEPVGHLSSKPARRRSSSSLEIRSRRRV